MAARRSSDEVDLTVLYLAVRSVTADLEPSSAVLLWRPEDRVADFECWIESGKAA
jgi:hypothetical protein